MLEKTRHYTVESVTSGHPDKLCDQVSDALLDEYLKQDRDSRVAIETFVGHGLLVIGGEVTSRGEVEAEAVARQVYHDIGYNDGLKIITNIVKQSPDIALGVDSGGAGDQGIMYGYATRESDAYLPRGVVLAHALTQGLEKLRKDGVLPWLRPDGKSLVTVNEGEIQTVLISSQHSEDVSNGEINKTLIDKLIRPLVGDLGQIKILVNPTGKFVLGGPTADTGLTGRKIMVDTYGGLIPHGGGCFSGKDATKVDRSAAYMARFVAKNLVANGLADKCLVSVAYAIGQAEPVMIEAINEQGQDLSGIVKEKFDFRPQAIIERLNLKSPIFRQTAVYGHFGKASLPWEEIITI